MSVYPGKQSYTVWLQASETSSSLHKVTRPLLSGPVLPVEVKVELSGTGLLGRLNWPKLWNRLLPACLPRFAPDRVVWPDQGLRRRETAVDHDVLRQNRPRVAEGERADGERREIISLEQPPMGACVK